jgi:hypothetical protein
MAKKAEEGAATVINLRVNHARNSWRDIAPPGTGERGRDWKRSRRLGIRGARGHIILIENTVDTGPAIVLEGGLLLVA